MLLDQIVAGCMKVSVPSRFWEIAEAYELDPYRLRLASAWRLPFPIANHDGAVEWRLVQDLGVLDLTLAVDDKEYPSLSFEGNRKLRITNELQELQREHAGISLYLLSSMLMGMSSLVAKSATEFRLLPRMPRADESLADLRIRDGLSGRSFFEFGGDIAEVLCVTGDHGFANAGHPVVMAGRVLNRKPWHERSAFEQILGYLLWGNVGGNFNDEVSPNSYTARHRKRFGMLYRAVDWNSVHRSLQPPYLVFRPGVGVQELTAAHFERWANAKLEEEGQSSG